MLIKRRKNGKHFTNEMLEIMADGRRLEQVDSFVYFGSNVKKAADCAWEVKSRTTMDNGT